MSVVFSFQKACGQVVLLSFFQVRKPKGERPSDGKVTQGKGRAELLA